MFSRCLSTIWWRVKDRVLARWKLEFISRLKLEFISHDVHGIYTWENYFSPIYLYYIFKKPWERGGILIDFWYINIYYRKYCGKIYNFKKCLETKHFRSTFIAPRYKYTLNNECSGSIQDPTLLICRFYNPRSGISSSTIHYTFFG